MDLPLCPVVQFCCWLCPYQFVNDVRQPRIFSLEGLYHSGDEQKVEGVTDISGQHQRDVPQGEPGVGYSCEEHQAGEVSEPEDRSFGCCCDFAPLSGRSLGCGVIARTSDGHGQA